MALNFSSLLTFSFVIFSVSTADFLESSLEQDWACYGSVGNSLVDANCNSGEVIAVESVEAGAKQVATGCPPFFNETINVTETQCCTHNPADDCLQPYTLDNFHNLCSGKEACTATNAAFQPTGCTDSGINYLDPTNYMLLNYFCIDRTRINELCSPANVDTSEPIYLWNNGYGGLAPFPGPILTSDTFCSCSVEVQDCDVKVKVYTVHLQMKEDNGTCKQNITIRDGGGQTTIHDCDNNRGYLTDILYTSVSNYIEMTFMNNLPVPGGNIWLGLTADVAGNNLRINCPPQDRMFCTTSTSTTTTTTTTTTAPPTTTTTTTTTMSTTETSTERTSTTETTSMSTSTSTTQSTSTTTQTPSTETVNSSSATTTSDSTTADSGGGANFIPIVVPVCVGVLAIALVVIIGILYYSKRKKKRGKDNVPEDLEKIVPEGYQVPPSQGQLKTRQNSSENIPRELLTNTATCNEEITMSSAKVFTETEIQSKVIEPEIKTNDAGQKFVLLPAILAPLTGANKDGPLPMLIGDNKSGSCIPVVQTTQSTAPVTESELNGLLLSGSTKDDDGVRNKKKKKKKKRKKRSEEQSDPNKQTENDEQDNKDGLVSMLNVSQPGDASNAIQDGGTDQIIQFDQSLANMSIRSCMGIENKVYAGEVAANVEGKEKKKKKKKRKHLPEENTAAVGLGRHNRVAPVEGTIDEIKENENEDEVHKLQPLDLPNNSIDFGADKHVAVNLPDQFGDKGEQTTSKKRKKKKHKRKKEKHDVDNNDKDEETEEADLKN